MKTGITISIDPETGMIEMETSGGKLTMTHLEAGLIYLTLKKMLGIRGRFLLWKMRKQLSSVSGTGPNSESLE